MTTNKKPSFVERIKQLYHFLTSGIWTITEKELTKSTRFSVRLLKKLILSARGVTEDNLFIKASALSYYTLLALVPILALVIAIGRGFGFQAAVVDWLTHALSAQAEMIPYIIEFVENYLQRAQGGVFLGVGFAILIWSVLSAFRQIENNFNDIWDVKKSRSIVRQFTMYISLMLLIPILIALSSGFSIFINTQLANSGLSDFFSPLTRFFLKIAPYFIYSLLFTIMFLIIPNTKVQFKHALLAGVVSGVAFQLFQWLYVSGQINLSNYNAVYGSFAAIPLLLMFLQISWLIVLYGAELTFVSQNLQNYNFENETKHISRRYKDYLTLMVMKISVTRFEQGEKPLTPQQIADDYNIPVRLVNQILKLLVNTRLLSEIYADSHQEKTYQPAMDIHQITIQLLFDRISKLGSENFKVDNKKEFDGMWEKLEQFRQNIASKSNDLLIKDL
ncbi:MAG: YihY/virulence factor BrkB family protein [Paludibacteraceae bacterium]|nr:YihY/virulence factor BrkB family protein [Paludibacteraceae bacterium]